MAKARLEQSARLQAAWSKGVTRGLAILPSLKENEGLLATSYKGFPSNPASKYNERKPTRNFSCSSIIIEIMQ